MEILYVAHSIALPKVRTEVAIDKKRIKTESDVGTPSYVWSKVSQDA